jgi:plastocyanin
MPRLVSFSGAVAVVLCFGCGGGDDINQPGSRPEHSVSIVSRAETKATEAFSPNPQSVPVNGVVHWYNDDRAAAGGQYGGSSGTIHTINADDLSFLSGNLTPGRSFEHTFAAPGTYAYHCSIHPTMRGTITVTP